jgi:tetratricopeptide (TPR) repeat protein
MAKQAPKFTPPSSNVTGFHHIDTLEHLTRLIKSSPGIQSLCFCWLTLLLTPPLLVACEACGPSIQRIENTAALAERETHRAHTQGARAASNARNALAISSAQGSLYEAMGAFTQDGLEAYEMTCQTLLNEGAFQETLSCIESAAEHNHRSVLLDLTRASSYEGIGDHDAAREMLWELHDNHPMNELITETLLTSFTSDLSFMRPTVTLVDGVQLDDIRALGGGSTITLRLTLNGENVGALKPNQTRGQSYYRSEIAAYRFCSLIRCNFNIPLSYEVRIHETLFRRLYGVRSLEPQHLASMEGYARHFQDLIWEETSGQRYLHGVWKDWIHHFTKFPIEHDMVWQPWLSQDNETAVLALPLEEALSHLETLDSRNYREILEEAGDLTTHALAAQISDLLVFDFLINNWDRFSGIYFGVNCQFSEGQFVSLDNGASFTVSDAGRARSHLHDVERFSRNTINAIRFMDVDRIWPLLFPDPIEEEMQYKITFMERRTELMNYVDNLISQWGEESVLFFD